MAVFALALAERASHYPFGKSLKASGPGFFPFVLCVILALLSIGLVFVSLARKEKSPKFIWPERKAGIVVVLAAILSYGLLLEPLGFTLTTFLFAFGLFKFGYPSRWFLPLAGAAATSLSTMLLFRIWLGTPFPTGILGF